MFKIKRALALFAVVAGLGACTSGATKTATTTSTSGGASTTAAGGSACGSTTTVPGSTGGPEASPPGDIPDNQAFVAFSPADHLYTVKIPEGWARTDESGAVAFTDKLNRIEIRAVNAAAAPTVASAKADDVAMLTASAPCFRLVDVTTVSRKAGPAVLVRYTADSAPDRVTGKVVRDDVERYEFWKNGKEVVLTLSGPVGSDNVDPWKIVTDGFAWQ